MTDLSDLIAKLETAEKGSRELDALVWVAILPRDGEGFDGFDCPEGRHYEYDAEEDGKVNLYVVLGNKTSMRRAKRPAPHYTTSLDAALPLVPEGWKIVAMSNVGGNAFQLMADKLSENEPPKDMSLAILLGDSAEWVRGSHRGGAALALCIAALKAREAQP